jgi:hypothetical protein
MTTDKRGRVEYLLRRAVPAMWARAEAVEPAGPDREARVRDTFCDLMFGLEDELAGEADNDTQF